MRDGGRSARALRTASLALVIALPACAHGQGSSGAVGPVRANTAALRKTLDSLAAAHHGIVGYSVRNLNTGERLERRGDETFPTASLIKVAILVTLYDLVEKGQMSLDDPLTLLKIDQVPGSGTLQHMHPGMTLTVRDATWLMSTTSDNTATNLILDKILIHRVWAKMDSLGLPNTRVHHKSTSGRSRAWCPTARKSTGLARARRTRWPGCSRSWYGAGQ
jgi:beta-lactamase class A